MFFHTKDLQYNADPERPDPLFAMKMQEVLGGQFGEMTVMMQYLFQGWSCRGPAKYKDMLLDIGTEEIAHVEMLCCMIGKLLQNAPLSDQDAAAENSPLIGAILGGMNPQHAIVAGLGALPTNSMGVPWNGGYMVASGNLLADFRHNLTAESQGRLQVTRIYNMTMDRGVRDMLSFMIARDTMHQNLWMAAIQELENDGLETTPCPSSFPQTEENGAVAYQFWNMSQGTDSAEGSWAQGPSPDGKGQFEYVESPAPMGPKPVPPVGNMLLYGTEDGSRKDALSKSR